MPGSDDRLEHALRDAAREPALDGVAEGVRAKWSRRRAIRRVERAALVGALAAGVIVIGVVALDTTPKEQHVTVAPARGAIPVVRVTEGFPVTGKSNRRAAVATVRLDEDEGYLRGPLLVTDGVVTLVAYDRSGKSFTFPPSRIVRVRADGTVVDRVDLQGEILSLAEGEGARWALTHDKTVIGPEDPEFRLKRIGPDGTVASSPVPPGEQPTGQIIASGGGVWVPVRDGVLRFDVTTGVYAGKVPLETVTDRRSVVQLGKGVSVTDGPQLKRLDPSSDRAVDAPGDTIPPRYEFVDVVSRPGGAIALAKALGIAVGSRWLVVEIDSGGSVTANAEVKIPPAMQAESLRVAENATWVLGSVDGDPAGFLIHIASATSVPPVFDRTLTITDATDVEVLPADSRVVFVMAGGSLYRVRLPG